MICHVGRASGHSAWGLAGLARENCGCGPDWSYRVKLPSRRRQPPFSVWIILDPPVLPFGSFSTPPILSPISIYFRYFSLFFQLSSLRYNISTVLLAFVPPWPQVSFPPGLGDVETGKSARNFGDGSGVRFRDKSTFDTSPKFCIDELLWRTDA